MFSIRLLGATVLCLGLAACTGNMQNRVISEVGNQGSIVVFTPEQTAQIREMAKDQIPEECPTAVGSFVKNTQNKITLVLRCN